MERDRHPSMFDHRFWSAQGKTAAAALAFYTCLPVPTAWTLEFRGIARFAPAIGIFIGALLGIVDSLLQALAMPLLTASALAIAANTALTGGLHLDGVMDTADGLAVTDPQRRLAVMSDSVTGAFGVMAAITVIVLKTAALADLHQGRGLALMAAAGWGRWGQLAAILRYPYLKARGKGAFHKTSVKTFWEAIPGLVLLLGLSGVQWIVDGDRAVVALGTALGGSAIAILTGAWFARQLGGHTGDTYGAVVEWTEALLLCLLSALANSDKNGI